MVRHGAWQAAAAAAAVVFRRAQDQQTQRDRDRRRREERATADAHARDAALEFLDAIEAGDMHAVRAYAGDIDVMDGDGRTALMRAAMGRNAAGVTWCLNNGVGDFAAVDKANSNAVALAATAVEGQPDCGTDSI